MDGSRSLDLFRQWDADGDGTVSRQEFVKGMLGMGVEGSRKDFEALFDMWDHDGGGSLDSKELHKALKSDISLDAVQRTRAEKQAAKDALERANADAQLEPEMRKARQEEANKEEMKELAEALRSAASAGNIAELTRMLTASHTLSSSATTGRLHDVTTLLSSATLDGSTALHKASMYGRAEAIDSLVRYGMPVDVRDNRGRTPLMLAAINGKLSAVKALLLADANPVLADAKQGRTAIMAAAAAGHADVVRELIGTIVRGVPRPDGTRGRSVALGATTADEPPLPWYEMADLAGKKADELARYNEFEDVATLINQLRDETIAAKAKVAQDAEEKRRAKESAKEARIAAERESEIRGAAEKEAKAAAKAAAREAVAQRTAEKAPSARKAAGGEGSTSTDKGAGDRPAECESAVEEMSEGELRTTLRPMFDKFDEVGSYVCSCRRKAACTRGTHGGRRAVHCSI